MANFTKNQKHMGRIFLVSLSILLFASCSSAGFEKTQNGIIVRLKQKSSSDTRTIRLNVVNDKVIHVTASPERRLSDEKSLIIQSGLKLSEKFNVEESGNTITLSTDSLDVKINKTTGEIAFFNKTGEYILRENENGGKKFIPIEIEGTKGYTLHQVFESPDDEALHPPTEIRSPPEVVPNATWTVASGTTPSLVRIAAQAAIWSVVMPALTRSAVTSG